MPEENNSAIEMLLKKINDLNDRVEKLEGRGSYTTCTTSVPIGINSSYGHIGATPTVTRTEAVAYRNRYEDRLHDLERQLDDMNNARFEVRDGNLYFTGIGNDGETN